MHHVAIMKKSWGLTEKILTGEKTIESRWYMARYAPWDRIHAGDVVFFQNAGEPVTLCADVRRVLQFPGLTPTKVRNLLHTYGNADGISARHVSEYYRRFRNKKYCVVVFLAHTRTVRPFRVNKTGFGAMAAWITVPNIAAIQHQL